MRAELNSKELEQLHLCFGKLGAKTWSPDLGETRTTDKIYLGEMAEALAGTLCRADERLRFDSGLKYTGWPPKHYEMYSQIGSLVMEAFGKNDDVTFLQIAHVLKARREGREVSSLRLAKRNGAPKKPCSLANLMPLVIDNVIARRYSPNWLSQRGLTRARITRDEIRKALLKWQVRTHSPDRTISESQLSAWIKRAGIGRFMEREKPGPRKGTSHVLHVRSKGSK